MDLELVGLIILLFLSYAMPIALGLIGALNSCSAGFLQVVCGSIPYILQTYDSYGTSVYCAKTLYLFAFWFTNACYICIGVGLVFGLYSYLKSDGSNVLQSWNCKLQYIGLKVSLKMDQIRAISSAAMFVTLNVITWMLLIALVAVGALYIHDCPKQPYIPIFLVVTGVCTAVCLLLSCLAETLEKGALSFLYTTINITLYIFSFIWFITGNAWVYSIYPPNYESPGNQEYCHKTLLYSKDEKTAKVIRGSPA
ncbi:hypothetical protein SKAU_G00371560 [Synaphobranchus kaupii]|uniref:Uncharacterized protein n=1 Tax=Synaphobranchus kaupii TaxID=118154 RepID=A0A9Q1IF20_SYNKA|nr:hypothetical protein SKAU_G00371560 [Synaphobranchus kaupii]